MLRREINDYVVCEECGHDIGSVNHLWDRPTHWGTQWYCRGCGRKHDVIKTDESFITKSLSEYRQDVLVILKRDALFLAVKGMTFMEDGEAFNEDKVLRDCAYYYEEHTCPINFVGGDVEQVATLETTGVGVRETKYIDTDPHGCFEVIHVELMYNSADIEERLKEILELKYIN